VNVNWLSSSHQFAKGLSMTDKWWVALICAVTILIVTGIVYLPSYWNGNTVLGQCDEAIQSKLKAPATFHRISYSGTMVEKHGLFEIVYDAENSFGVPLRSHGWCTVDRSANTVMWDDAGGLAG
jgi:hypothetical protein